MLTKLLKERAALFKDRNFTLISISGLMSTFGNGLTYVATSWFAYEQISSISGVALMMFLLWAPSIIFSPIFGVCADRYNKKHVIIMSNVVRGVAILIFSCFLLLNININVFYLAFILGLFVSFYMPAMVPLITSILPKKDFVKANSTIDMIYEVGVVLGMGMSGVLILLVGMKWTLLTGGLFFTTSGFIIALLNYDKVKQKDSSPKTSNSLMSDYIQTFGYLKGKHNIINVHTIQMFVMYLLMTIPVLLVSYTKEVINAGTTVFSLFECIYSLGILIDCFFIPSLNDKFGFDRLISFLMLGMACSLFVMSQSTFIPISLLAYFTAGLCLSSWALTLSHSQLVTDVNYQGRMQSLVNSLSGILILTTYLLITLKKEFISIQNLYLIESCIALLTSLWVMINTAKNRTIENG